MITKRLRKINMDRIAAQKGSTPMDFDRELPRGDYERDGITNNAPDSPCSPAVNTLLHAKCVGFAA